ncbi:hypothetical protein [Streptomyces sp. FH025]|uniref:hypothetical protein n=1 Tax=Streptomyces sp. FH025 TaxID=2815937 RepID=UPI001A9D1EF8|nr:hypothetical protein [Streptomyces sp. FH025]MBO1415173.1 hypothetical protein [Streptomyces sp. FH025]
MSDSEPTCPDQPLNSELAAILAEVAAAPPGWEHRLTPDARLDGDLLLDECELADLALRLRERFGASADLAALRAGLDLAGLEALTLADVQALLPEEDAR